MPVGFPDYFGGLTLPVTVQEGGTGQTSITANALLYGAGTSGLIPTNVGTSGQILQINPVSLVPTFQDLTVDVSAITGILPLANGGTGTATPALVAGANIALSGSFPAQTVALAASVTITTLDAIPTVTGTGLTLHGNTTTPISPTVKFYDDTGATVRGQFGVASKAGDFITNMVIGDCCFMAKTGTLRLGTNNIDSLNINQSQIVTLTHPLPIASGGTGTATPALVAGTNISISGAWPDQTVALSATPSVTKITTGTVQFTGTTRATALGIGPDTTGTILLLVAGSSGYQIGNSILSGILLSGDSSGNTTIAGTLQIGGMLTSYNGVATAGAGIPAIVAVVNLTGQTGTKASATLFTPGAAGFYRASVAVFASGASGDTATASIGWTQNSVAFAAAANAASNGVAASLMWVLYSDASKAITYEVAVSATSPTWDLHIRLEAL